MQNDTIKLKELLEYRRSLIAQIEEGFDTKETWEFLKFNTEKIKKIREDFKDDYSEKK